MDAGCRGKAPCTCFLARSKLKCVGERLVSTFSRRPWALRLVFGAGHSSYLVTCPPWLFPHVHITNTGSIILVCRWYATAKAVNLATQCDRLKATRRSHCQKAQGTSKAESGRQARPQCSSLSASPSHVKLSPIPSCLPLMMYRPIFHGLLYSQVKGLAEKATAAAGIPSTSIFRSGTMTSAYK